jgi:hypothetical protein
LAVGVAEGSAAVTAEAVVEEETLAADSAVVQAAAGPAAIGDKRQLIRAVDRSSM